MKLYKIFNFIKKYKFLFIAMMLFIGVCFHPKHISAKEANVVKVGYPTVSGFTEIEDGVYTGYAYEYLVEIAKYTGWEYEFVEMSLKEMFHKLKDGEIDIAGGMLRNEATLELYDFPEENAGYTYTTLAVLKDNNSISSSNYETLNGMKVGYYTTSIVRLNSFKKFCKDNGIENVELIAFNYDDNESLIAALKAKEIDAMITGDLLINDNEKVIARFGAVPYYYATTKGNTKILTALNKAITKIKENNPNFELKLYNKYFKNNNDNVVHLTKEEQEYIVHMTPLKAVYVDNYAPMQDYNPKTKSPEGVYVDFWKLIAQKAGLKYELVKTESHEEAFEMNKNKEADIFIAAPDNYLKAVEFGYTQTQDYMEVNMVKVININEKNQDRKQIIALPVGYVFTDFEGEYEIEYYETIEDCLFAVNKGEANATYGNSYTISKYVSSGYYPKLSMIYNELPIKASIGISKPTNLILLNIINKSISSISDSEIKEIIYSNTLNVKNKVTLKLFFFDNLIFCTVVILIFVSMIGIIISNKYKRLKKDKIALLKKSQTDVLTGVYNRATGTDLITHSLQIKKVFQYSAFIIIDIDYFKQVNDLLGHQRGDELLIEFSQLLTRVFTNEDIIFRLGGDEFIVFMPNLLSSNLKIVDEKLQEISHIMDKELSYKGNTQKISLSIGAIVTNQVQSFNELYQEADKMLYEVKRNGRNGFKISGYPFA